MDEPLTDLKQKPIGVFDSGIGGLTVVREIFRKLPREAVVYFGDTARVPYGSKSAQTVRTYALQNCLFLRSQDVKAIVIACNTASAVALDVVRRCFDLPVIGVIEPGAQAAVQATRNGRIGVIGTVGTIATGAYVQAIRRLNPEMMVFSQPCPLFVPLVEEGWLDREVTRLVAGEYLAPLRAQGVDTLILGCTHYPLLKGVISEVMGDRVQLIDSAEATARELRQLLRRENLQNDSPNSAVHRFFISDFPYRFQEVGEKFLGEKLPQVSQVSVETIDLGSLISKGEGIEGRRQGVAAP